VSTSRFYVCPFLGGAQSLHELPEPGRLGRSELEPRQEVEGLSEVAPVVQTRGDRWQVQPDELLRVERITLGPLDDRLLQLRSEVGTAREMRDELGRLLIRERGEVDCMRVVLPGAPPWAVLLEFRPRSAQDEQRHALRPLG
jgi:hypothetical protein